MSGEHDLIVVGGGPAGYAAALYGSASGLDVGLVEERRVGGTCLHVGCIPAKELLETASVLRTVRSASDFGVSVGEPVVDLVKSQKRKEQVVDTLFKGLTSMLAKQSVNVYSGKGTLGSSQTVTVEGETAGVLKAPHVVLATGSEPRTIPGFDCDGTLVVTSDDLLSITEVPSRVVVIGGGAIGCEFASLLSDLGSAVTLLEAASEILPGCDADAARTVRRAFERRGIQVCVGVQVCGHEPNNFGTSVKFREESLESSVDVDLVVVAVGRRPRGDSAGLVGTQVKVDEFGFVEVNERLHTDEPGVYAIGDVVSTPQLAHVGFAEGIFVVRDLLDEDPLPIDAATVPWCIYSHPEVAFAGLTEAAAQAAGYDVTVSTHRFVGNSRARIVGETDGFVKVVAQNNLDGSAGSILGVHLVGPWVTEQLGQGYLAVNWEATVEDVAFLVQPHPTFSELFGEAVLSLTGRSLHG